MWELNNYICISSGVLVQGTGCITRLGRGKLLNLRDNLIYLLVK